MPDERDATPITERLGRPFALEKSPGVKRYPAVTPSHGVITAALKLAAQGGYAVEDIEKVEFDFRTFSLSRMAARDEEEAGFCAPYLIAASLVHGAFGPEQIMPAAIDDPRVQKLSARVVQIPKNCRRRPCGDAASARRQHAERAGARRARLRAGLYRAQIRSCAAAALKPARPRRSAISSRISMSSLRSTG